MGSVLASTFGAKPSSVSEKDFTAVPEGFYRISPELDAVVTAAVNPPTPERMAELLSRRPGPPVPNFVDINTVDAFFEKMKALYPDQYRDPPTVEPIATREQVVAAIAAKIASAPGLHPSTSITTEDNPMSQHFIDQYTAHYKAMRREPNMLSVSLYAQEYAASTELQAEFKNFGGIVAYIAQRRAVDEGRVRRLGDRR